MFQKLICSDELCDDIFQRVYNDKYYNYLISDKAVAKLFNLSYKSTIYKLFDLKIYYFIEEVITDYIQKINIFKSEKREINVNSEYYKGLYNDIDNMIKNINNEKEKEHLNLIKNRVHNIIKTYNLQ